MNLGAESDAGDQPLRLDVAYVSGDFFSTMGVTAADGRTLRPDEDVEGSDRVAVLSDGLWHRRFDADSAIVGQTIPLSGRRFTVIGVMPASFRFPGREDRGVDLWAPLSLIGEDNIPTHRAIRWQEAVGRLAPGVGVAEARSAASAALAHLADEHPDTNEGWRAAGVVPLRETVVGEVRAPLLTLLAAVAVVLLIVCANLASLLLARLTGRERELAVRAALGAGRRELIRPLLAEAAVLAATGGVLGLAVAWEGVHLLVSAAGEAVARPEAVRLDGRVLLFTLGLTVLTGLLVGLLPALRAGTSRGVAALHGTAGSGGGGGQRVRATLVVAETALAVALLVGAGLLLRSVWHLAHQDPGFRTDLLALSISATGDSYSDGEELVAYHHRLIGQVRAVPGVVAVGGSKTMPLRGGGEPFRFGLPGREGPVAPEAGAFIVTSGYFQALGVPLRAGRLFDERAAAEGRPELVVSESFARQVWGSTEVVGKILLAGKDLELPVVGVVGDVRTEGLATAPGSAVYVPLEMAPRSTLKIFARTAGTDPLALADAVRQAIWRVNPDQPVSEMTTLGRVAAEQTARPRLLTWLLGGFAALALVLAALGLYGVVAYAVGRQRREIGIRMALGADRARVLLGVLGRSSLLTGAGLLAGLFLAWAGGRLLASQLYGVQPTDLPAFGGAALALALVSLAAAAIPARRATRVDPARALREE